MGELLRYRDAILKIVPRWLRKGSIGPGVIGRVLYAIGIQLDSLADALVEGVKRRFPGLNGQYDSLPLLGADRRIARGPTETDAGYAARLLPWQQAHRGRGGAYAMLTQLYGFWQGAFAIDLIYFSGKTYSIDTSGNITTSQQAGTHVPAPWAQWWLVFHWPTSQSNDGKWGDPGVWGDGGVWGSDLLPATVANILIVPTEWNAAHASGHVVLLCPGASWDWTTGAATAGTVISIPVK